MTDLIETTLPQVDLPGIIAGSYFDYYEDEMPARGRVSPSKIVSGCLLTVYYDLLEEDYIEEERDYDNALTLEVGKFLHERIQTFLQKYYESLGWLYKAEVPVTVTDMCRGSMDARIMNPDCSVMFLDEYKTCSEGVFDSVKRMPMPYNEDQVQIYLMGAKVFPFARLVYLSRGTFRLKQHIVYPNPERQKELLDLIHQAQKAAEDRKPPNPSPHFLGTNRCTKVCKYRHKCSAALKHKNSSRRRL